MEKRVRKEWGREEMGRWKAVVFRQLATEGEEMERSLLMINKYYSKSEEPEGRPEGLMQKVADLCETSPGLFFSSRRLEKNSPGLFLTSGELFETPSAQPRFSWGNNPSNGLFRSCCSRFFAKKTSRLSSTERGWAKASTFSSAEGYSSMFKRRNTKEGSKPRPMAVRATFCLRAKGVAAWAERSLLLRNCFSVSV